LIADGERRKDSSFTAKDAKDTKEEKSLTAKDAKGAKDNARYLGRFTWALHLGRSIWDALSGTLYLRGGVNSWLPR
jgi:hypothetical protein